jgi:hypothetical protein
MADGLWAYAFFSCILIIWKRCISAFWIVTIVVVFIAFEYMQLRHIISGTFDYLDIVIYLAFSAFAFFTNNFFKQYFNHNNQQKINETNENI